MQLTSECSEVSDVSKKKNAKRTKTVSKILRKTDIKYSYIEQLGLRLGSIITQNQFKGNIFR